MTSTCDRRLRRRTDRLVAALIITLSVIVCTVGFAAWASGRRALAKVERVQVEACHHIRTLQHQVNTTHPTGKQITVITCPKAGD